MCALAMILGCAAHLAFFSEKIVEPLGRLRIPEWPEWDDWEDVLEMICDLSIAGKLRERIRRLPALDGLVEVLRVDIAQARRAYVVSMLLAHAYVRGNRTEALQNAVPCNLGVFYCAIAKCVDQRTVVNYFGMCMWNWFLLDKYKPATMDNIGIRHTLSGSTDEKWFLLVPLKIDFLGHELLKMINCALDSSELGNYSEVDVCLVQIRDTVATFKDILRSMYSECDMQYFYKFLRKNFMGTTPESGLDDGMLICGNYVKLPGGSAGQNPTIHLLDAFLGISYENNKETHVGMRSMLESIPAPEMAVIERVRARSAAMTRSAAAEGRDQTLRLLSEVVSEMSNFGGTHKMLVKSYIIDVVEATGAGVDASVVGACPFFAGSTAKDKMKDMRGTGNTTIMTFLRNVGRRRHERLVELTRLRQHVHCPYNLC